MDGSASHKGSDLKDGSTNHKGSGLKDGSANHKGSGLMAGSTNHRVSGVTDSSVNLFARAPSWSTAVLTSSPRHAWYSNVFIYLLRNNESAKQQKYETTKVWNNEKATRNYERAMRINERAIGNYVTAKQRNCKTTKVRDGHIRTPTLSW